MSVKSSKKIRQLTIFIPVMSIIFKCNCSAINVNQYADQPICFSSSSTIRHHHVAQKSIMHFSYWYAPKTNAIGPHADAGSSGRRHWKLPPQEVVWVTRGTFGARGRSPQARPQRSHWATAPAKKGRGRGDGDDNDGVGTFPSAAAIRTTFDQRGWFWDSDCWVVVLIFYCWCVFYWYQFWPKTCLIYWMCSVSKIRLVYHIARLLNYIDFLTIVLRNRKLLH